MHRPRVWVHSARITVKRASGGEEETLDAAKADIFPANEADMTPGDHCALIHLNEPCVLENSRMRFRYGASACTSSSDITTTARAPIVPRTEMRAPRGSVHARCSHTAHTPRSREAHAKLTPSSRQAHAKLTPSSRRPPAALPPARAATTRSTPTLARSSSRSTPSGRSISMCAH